MDLRLTGRRAVVTVCTRGLGRAVVQRLAEEGCALALCARSADVVERSWARRRDDDPAASAAFVARELPHGRSGTPQEAADVAAFLLSPRASWVSGTDVVVDGAQNAPSTTGY